MRYEIKKMITLSGQDVEVNIDEIVREIDHIMHEKITKISGITIDHEKIRNFVRSVIDENNAYESGINAKLDIALKADLP